mmetsp:Transcript_8425/g.25309  ORF Transcript_8425/g.25309 Transcript_8425/m.25309 type:complete len:485 (-) Transcript_8425:482-1936(-)
MLSFVVGLCVAASSRCRGTAQQRVRGRTRVCCVSVDNRDESSEEASIVLIGVNARSCDEAAWKRLSIGQSKWQIVGREFRDVDCVSEAAALSTNDRLEIYAASNAEPRAVVHDMLLRLQAMTGLDSLSIRRNCFFYFDEEAARHLLAFACGVDRESFAGDEPLSVIERCMTLASDQEFGAGAEILGEFFSSALTTARRIRKECGLSSAGVDEEFAAVEALARFYSRATGRKISDSKVSVVGSKTKARRVLRALLNQQIHDISVIGAGPDELPQMGAQFPFTSLSFFPADMLPNVVAMSEVVICASEDSSDIVITEKLLNDSLFGEKQILLLDISDDPIVEPSAGKRPRVTLVTRDDVADVMRSVQKSMGGKRKMVLERVQEESSCFRSHWFAQPSDPILHQLKMRGAVVLAEEVAKVKPKLKRLQNHQMQLVEEMANSIIERLMLGPLARANQITDEEEKMMMLKNLLEIFKWIDAEPKASKRN